MNKKQIRLLTQNTLIGALYVVLTLINPISYGMFQFRLSTLLMGVPFYKPQLSLGILIGVMIVIFQALLDRLIFYLDF